MTQRTKHYIAAATPPSSPSRSQLFLSCSLVLLWLGENSSLPDKHNRTPTELLLQLSYQSHLRSKTQQPRYSQKETLSSM